MTKFSFVDKCSICKKTKTVIKSNNPLVAPVCSDCLNEQLDYNNLKQANFFCKTYNIPFLPDRWLEMAEEEKEDTFLTYVSIISQEYEHTLYNSDTTDDLWEKANEEWRAVKTHQQLINKIKPIKDNWIAEMQIKWGNRFSFQQFMELENLYNSTIKAGAITNPLTMNIVKKIAITSVDMNAALDNQDIKAAGEYNKMLTQLIKSAGLENMVEIGETDVISTLSELCKYLEDNDFQFKFYDGVSRDIVDKTIADQQEWVRNFVLGATGIQQTYEMIEDAYKESLEQEATNKAIAKVPLDQLLQNKREGLNKELDEELENQDFDLGDFYDE